MNILKTYGLACVLLIGSQITAAPKPSNITIEKLAHNGSGCTKGSKVELAEANSSEQIKLEIEGFDVSTQKRVTRKNCVVGFSVEKPKGWQFAVNRLETHLSVSLEESAKARLTVNSYFQGEKANSRFEQKWQGPLKKELDINQTKNGNDLVWSNCGQTAVLNTNTAVLVRGASANVKLKQKIYWHFIWRQCQTK